MPMNSFGFVVLTLRDVIEKLQSAAADDPVLLDKAVWVKNCPPLYFPILRVEHGTDGVAIFVERGGN
jgi:hypothetical protein